MKLCNWGGGDIVKYGKIGTSHLMFVLLANGREDIFYS